MPSRCAGVSAAPAAVGHTRYPGFDADSTLTLQWTLTQTSLTRHWLPPRTAPTAHASGSSCVVRCRRSCRQLVCSLWLAAANGCWLKRETVVGAAARAVSRRARVSVYAAVFPCIHERRGRLARASSVEDILAGSTSHIKLRSPMAAPRQQLPVPLAASGRRSQPCLFFFFALDVVPSHPLHVQAAAA